MTITASTLAKACGAEILGGNQNVAIHSAANIDTAQANQLTFIASEKQACKLVATAASAVIVPHSTSLRAASHDTCLLSVADPEMAFITCLRQLCPEKSHTGTIHPKADIDATTSIGSDSFVAPFASIGAHSSIGKNCQVHAGCRIADHVTIGDNCVLYPNVVLYDGVMLGDNVIIHAGTVIGADGFGYKLRDGKHIKFPQVGTVIIESNVEIGANTCIDRASLGATCIGQGTKIDNQVHIAHNVQIGSHALLCGQVGIGGSTVIEDYVVLASQCGVADHVRVGTQAVVFAQAGVTKDIEARDQVMGFPAANRREALHHMAALRKIAGHQKAIEALTALLPKLKKLLD